jgi:hypothetical protein
MIPKSFCFDFFLKKGFQTQKYKIKNNTNNTVFKSTIPFLNDRLRKRRCFADKELDKIPVLSSIIESMMTNSAFHVAGLSRFRSNNYHQDKSTKTKANQKKCTDFSVAAIIGQS